MGQVRPFWQFYVTKIKITFLSIRFYDQTNSIYETYRRNIGLKWLYLHLPCIFPIKCVGVPSVLMRAWLHHYANQHSAIYIVLLSAYEVVDVNGYNVFPYVTFLC